MATTVLSTKGQLVLPKEVRESHQWDAGQELCVIDMPDCVILKARPVQDASWLDVVGILSRYRKAAPPTEAEMHEAVRQKAAERYRRSLEK